MSMHEDNGDKRSFCDEFLAEALRLMGTILAIGIIGGLLFAYVMVFGL